MLGQKILTWRYFPVPALNKFFEFFERIQTYQWSRQLKWYSYSSPHTQSMKAKGKFLSSSWWPLPRYTLWTVGCRRRRSLVVGTRAAQFRVRVVTNSAGAAKVWHNLQKSIEFLHRVPFTRAPIARWGDLRCFCASFEFFSTLRVKYTRKANFSAWFIGGKSL